MLSSPTARSCEPEISAKFTPERLAADLRAAGLTLVELYTDPEQLFAVSLVRARR
jgi:L-histidine N-alpha-methyltransferase